MKILFVLLVSSLGKYQNSKHRKSLRHLFPSPVFSAFAHCAFRESIDEFDQENNIIELNDDLKAEDAKRLQAVEAEINADNDKFEKGDASSGMKLYSWSDLSKDEIQAEKMGLSRGWDPKRGDAPPERAMGLIMPPESDRINSPQEDLDALYETDRGYAPRTYFAINDGLVTIAKNQGNCGFLRSFCSFWSP